MTVCRGGIYEGAALMEEKQLRQLMSEMTLKEKAGQMVQYVGMLYSGNTEEILTGPDNFLALTREDMDVCGTILGSVGAEELIRIQKNSMEKQPHHIPMLFMLDVIHGLKTVFPMPLALAATFDPQLTEECCAVAAREAAVSGVHVTFAPMADLVRDARWGRVMEALGEDPYLAGLMTAAMVHGFQGDNPSEKDRVAACVKHFAAYGASMAGRDYNEVEMDLYTLKNQYLRSYQAGIDAGAELVMSSFNTMNGVPMAANREMLRDLLRDKMGFDGVVISDFAALHELTVHSVAQDPKEAARKALMAGVDIDMVSTAYTKHLVELAEENPGYAELIDEAVWRILCLKNRLGLFENPFKDADPQREKEVILCSEHRALARQAAADSFVLLKNEGLLPLDFKSGKKIAFIGPYVDSNEVISSWAVAGNMSDCTTIREAAKHACREAGADPSAILFCQGSPMMGEKDYDSRDAAAFGHEDHTWEYDGLLRADPETVGNMLEEAAQTARGADLVVLAVGETRNQTGEACSRGMLDIPQVQMELVRRVCRENSHVIVVLFNGRPLDLREISCEAEALLEVWLPGTESGNAILDVLTGKRAPGGKLPMSFPYCVGQVPVYYNHINTGRPDHPGRQNHFLSRYLDIPNEPLYAFGYGLSYGDIRIGQPGLAKAETEDGTAADSSGKIIFHAGETLILTVEAENNGKEAGCEVIQVYLKALHSTGVRPVRELIAFQKIRLEPGESTKAVFEITEPMLRYDRPNGSYGSEPGEYELYTGSSSLAGDVLRFTLE